MIKIFYINTTYLAFIFIWFALRLNLLDGIDSAGRLDVFISIIVLMLNVVYNKNFLVNNSIKIWLIWFMYASLNSLFLFDDSFNAVSMTSFILYSLFVPFVIMSVTASFNEKDVNKFLNLLEYILFISVFLFFFNSKSMNGRIINESFNVNELVLVTNALVATIIIRSLLINRNLFKVIGLITFPSIYILLSGSRMGFGALLILVFGYWFATQNRNLLVFIIRLLFVGIISLFLFDLIIENTVLGERLVSTTTQSENMTFNPAEGTIFQVFGDRGIFYITAWSVFINNPVFGIGLLNYQKTNLFVLHVEYLIHLAELGIIGFALYTSFIYSLIKNIKFKNIDIYVQRKAIMLYFILLSIMFCATVLFLYKSFAIAYLFGLIILLSNHGVKSIKSQ